MSFIELIVCLLAAYFFCGTMFMLLIIHKTKELFSFSEWVVGLMGWVVFAIIFIFDDLSDHEEFDV